MVVYRWFEKLRYSNERSTKFESLYQEYSVEVFRGGKWQNSSFSNITLNREFVWIGWTSHKIICMGFCNFSEAPI